MMNLDIRNPKAQSSTVTVCDFAKNMMKHTVIVCINVKNNIFKTK